MISAAFTRLIPLVYSTRKLFRRSLASVALVDSFANKPFSGNPAAVVLTQGTTSWMQNLATELNIPVTAFVAKSHEDSSIRSIRWFTPKTELSICGHATLAASHILFASDQLNSCTQLMFRSEFCGDMCATKSTDGSVQFSFSGDTLVPVNLHEDDQRALSSALSISYSDIVFIGRTVSDLLIELTRQSFSRVAQVVDYAQLAKLAGRGVIITCKGKRRVAADEKDTYYCVSCGGHPYMNDPTFDYLLRAFYPKLGLPEDQATGSAQCILAPYYFDNDIGEMTHLNVYQASKRGGTMQVAVVKPDAAMTPARVVIAGKCRTIMQSTLIIPVE